MNEGVMRNPNAWLLVGPPHPFLAPTLPPSRPPLPRPPAPPFAPPGRRPPEPTQVLLLRVRVRFRLANPNPNPNPNPIPNPNPNPNQGVGGACRPGARWEVSYRRGQAGEWQVLAARQSLEYLDVELRCPEGCSFVVRMQVRARVRARVRVRVRGRVRD